MKSRYIVHVCFALAAFVFPLLSQTGTNCFLNDFEPKYAIVPPSVDSVKTTRTPTVFVTINGTDTLGKISKYVFGNAVAVWVGQDVNNPTLVPYLQKLAPTLIRYPGGSWSDAFFWNGDPGDLPSNIWQQNNVGALVFSTFYPQFGPNGNPSLDSYYNLREQLSAQGLITINYAYARYGLSANPVAQAAHYAADWVRYDNGRTAFWEIGNENAGPWEAGWRIDRTTNKDGQPDTITGALYGKHFKVFADSMKAAAAEKGSTIYIGGQIIQYDGTNSWNIADHGWNESFFKESGETADFYVMHNYFGNEIPTIKYQVDVARSEINSNISFIRQDITNKKAPVKPIALTEWNDKGPDLAKTSIANGMQAVTLFCEMIKNNFGMSCRWLIANWESDGMFYYGNSSSIPLWNPRPDFFYTYYVQKFTGDHVTRTSVVGSSDILAYASRFSSGHTASVLVNKGTAEKIVRLIPKGIGVGLKYYVYSLTGVDNTALPQAVVVNGHQPTPGTAWGPLDELETLSANAYPIEDTIKIVSPANSVQFVLIDNGDRILVGVDEENSQRIAQFTLEQNYPNPFNPSTVISYELPVSTYVTLKIYDILGRELLTLVSQVQTQGRHTALLDGKMLQSGVYFYRLQTTSMSITKKMILLK